MKNHELYTLQKILMRSEFINSKNSKVLYFTLKNLKKIEEEMMVFNKVKEFPPTYLEYDKQRVALCEKHCDKDENGKGILKDNQYIFSTENKALFDKEVVALIEQNKALLEETQAKQDTFNKMLGNDVLIEFYKMKLDLLPDFPEGKEITTPEMNVLMNLILDN